MSETLHKNPNSSILPKKSSTHRADIKFSGVDTTPVRLAQGVRQPSILSLSLHR